MSRDSGGMLSSVEKDANKLTVMTWSLKATHRAGGHLGDVGQRERAPPVAKLWDRDAPLG